MFQLWQCHLAVLTVLPEGCHVLHLVESHELELEGLRQGVGVETHHPLVVGMLCHVDGTQSLPVTQCITCSDDGQSLVVTQLWGAHLQTYRLGVRCLRACVQFPGSHTLRESRRVEEGILGDVYPVVVHRIAYPFLGSKLQTMRLHEPLRPFQFVTTYNTVIIVHLTGGSYRLADLCRPMDTIECTHLMLFGFTVRQDVHHQFLAEGGLVLQMKVYSHAIIGFC